MARKKGHEDHANHEAWAIPYGDLVTLLLAFFVVMYSTSSVNEGKYRVLSETLSAAFNGTPKAFQPLQMGTQATMSRVISAVTTPQPAAPMTGVVPRIPIPIPANCVPNRSLKISTWVPGGKGKIVGAKNAVGSGSVTGGSGTGDGSGTGGSGAGSGASGTGTGTGVGDAIIGKGTSGGSGTSGAAGVSSAGSSAESAPGGLGQIAEEVEKALIELIDSQMVIVRRNESWIEVEIKTDILFPSGVATFSTDALPLLKQLAEILRGFPNPLRIEGYTDNVPISTAMFPSNWELSAARAASVARLFLDKGIDPHRVAIMGFGEYRPAVDNATAEGRNRNRRVLIVIFSSTRHSQGFYTKQETAGTGTTAGAAAVLESASNGVVATPLLPSQVSDIPPWADILTNQTPSNGSAPVAKSGQKIEPENTAKPVPK